LARRIPANQETTMGRTLHRVAGDALIALALVAASSDARADDGNKLTAADIAKAMGVQHPTSFLIQTDNINGDISYQVPASQRLIIEFIATSCSLTSGSSLTGLALRVLENNTVSGIPLSVTPASTAESASVTFGQMVRIYIDPSTTLQINPIGHIGNGGELACDSDVFGQLIDVP